MRACHPVCLWHPACLCYPACLCHPACCAHRSLLPLPTNLLPQFLTIDSSPPSEHPPSVRRRQQRIAEITELIHVASLLHDDVIDSAGTRRGKKSLNAVFGNKVGGRGGWGE